MTKKVKNVAASVHARLLQKAKAEGRSFNELLPYYGMERFLYRLSRTPYGKRFVLKGALALEALGGRSPRATKDIDLLGRQSASLAELRHSSFFPFAEASLFPVGHRPYGHRVTFLSRKLYHHAKKEASGVGLAEYMVDWIFSRRLRPKHERPPETNLLHLFRGNLVPGDVLDTVS